MYIWQVIKDRVILGIDPGTNVMGFGIIHVKDSNIVLLELGSLHMNKIEDHGTKLKMIFDKVLSLIDQYHPDELAAEAPFFGKNVQSMLKLGRAQGVALAAALYRNIPIFEYAPRKIKQSITGKGAASKEQVAAMVQLLLKLKDEEMPKYSDATDGVAAALCHYYQLKPGQFTTANKGQSGWKSFVTNNPSRIKP